MEVRMEGVTVRGRVPKSKLLYPTVATEVARAARALACRPRKMADVTLLDGVSATFAPGRLTLLLGPPQCGKTTLLKLMAGRLGPSYGSNLQVCVR